MKNLTKKQVLGFLNSHKAIKVSIFLKECGLGRNYLTQIEDSAMLTEEASKKLLPVMKIYGYNKKNLKNDK